MKQKHSQLKMKSVKRNLCHFFHNCGKFKTNKTEEIKKNKQILMNKMNTLLNTRKERKNKQ